LFLELVLLQSPPVLNLKSSNRYIATMVILTMWWIHPLSVTALGVPFCVEGTALSIEVKFLLTAVFNGAPTAISQR
jgi:hypothetical protein